jgi:prepilin-type processing-associated H-X9-DG protein
MPIDFKCPHCGNQTLVADQYAGQTGPCSKCGATVTIPPLPGTVPPAYSPGPAPATTAAAGAGAAVGVIIAVVAGAVICGGILLVALLLPAVQAAREAARRAQCANNMKQIGLAMHNYHDINGAFPPAYVSDSDGKPMHSWRVLILPYMEQQGLYSAYDQSQPWDAATNRALLSQMPVTYQCQSSGVAGQNTSYVVVRGPETMFDVDKPCKIADITDGTSNTIMVIEAPHANIPWTEPRDLDLAQATMAINAGANSPHSDHPGGAQVLFADGSVRFLKAGIPQDQLRAMFTKAGNEMVMNNF